MGPATTQFAHLFKKIIPFTFFPHQGSMRIKRGRGGSLSAFPVQRAMLNNEMLAALQIKVGNVTLT